MSDKEHLNPPFDGPHGWIQWKGTDVCMDVHCVCGNLGHIDAEFAYTVKCSACGRCYIVNGNVKLHEVSESEAHGTPVSTE